MNHPQKYPISRIPCRCCPQASVGFLLPPLCQQHLDLTIFITYLKRNRQPVTMAQLKTLATYYQGEVSISVHEVEPLLGQITRTSRPLLRRAG